MNLKFGWKMLFNLDVYNLIQRKLDNKESFSLVRIGDGEGVFFNNDINGIKFILNKHLGYVPENYYKINNNLIQACCKSDIIGVPTKRHLSISENWKAAQRGAYELGDNFCSIDIHLEMFKNGWLDEILSKQKEIFYINGRDIDFSNKFPNIKKVNRFIITPEMKYESNKKQELHYPDQYLKISDWMKELDCTGKLCLVGAGVVGKIYNIWFKKRGGISLDLGCVFDAWAGKCTRGLGRGVGIENNKHKI